MIIINLKKKIKLNQSSYNKIIDSIDFQSIICSSCSNNEWAFHASYSRKIDIHNRECEIIITRVICKHCGKTHAILIQDMIPFSILSHDTIISVLSSLDTSFVSLPHLFFLKKKYSPHNFFDYNLICSVNCRLFPILFYSST